jgi:signal transduction histidine kinase
MIDLKRPNILLFVICICCAVKGQTLDQRYATLDSLFDATIENHPDQALYHIIEMEKIGEKMHDDSLKLEVMEKKANCLLMLDQFDQSMQLRYDILAKYEKKKDYESAVHTLYDLGNQYFQMKDYARALDIFQRAKKMAIEKGNPMDSIKINLEIGLHLAGLKKYDEGIRLLKSNLSLAHKFLSEEDWVIGLDNLSNLYHEKKDYKNALKYQLEVYQSDFAHSSINAKTAVHQHLAEIYLNLKEYKNAQFHLDSAFHYGKILRSNDWLFDCYKNQYQIDLALGNYKSALNNHEKYLLLKDSVYQEQYDTKMSAMANLYELEHKQSHIKELEFEKQISENEIYRLYLVVISLVLFTMVLWLYYLYRRKKEAAETQKKYAAMLLQSQEEERQRIAKELHDSIGQNILFIKNQIKKVFDSSQPELTASVDGILQDVRSISKNLYPNELERYGLENAVELLAKQVTEEFGIFVSSDLMGIDAKTSKPNKINLYRIMQEFVNNSIKHAQSKAIRITSDLHNNTIQLILQDNGIGFDVAQVQSNAHRSFGLLNIEERIKMMDGNLTFETAPGQGTKFIINLPFS